MDVTHVPACSSGSPVGSQGVKVVTLLITLSILNLTVPDKSASFFFCAIFYKVT